MVHNVSISIQLEVQGIDLDHYHVVTVVMAIRHGISMKFQYQSAINQHVELGQDVFEKLQLKS